MHSQIQRNPREKIWLQIESPGVASPSPVMNVTQHVQAGTGGETD